MKYLKLKSSSLAFLFVLCSCLMLSSNSTNQNLTDVVELPHTLENQFAYSEEDVKDIVAKALERGKKANILAAGDFQFIRNEFYTSNGSALNRHTLPKNIDDYDDYYDDYFENEKNECDYMYHAIDTLYQGKPTDYNMPEALEIVQEVKSTDEIKQYFYNTFTKEAADKFLIGMVDGEECPLYKDINGKLYENHSVTAMPFFMGKWYLDTLTILENAPNKIVVEMDAEYGNKPSKIEKTERHSLTLVKEDGGWLMTESYSAPFNIYDDDYSI